MEDKPNIPTALQHLLVTYKDLFQEPATLSPSRGTFDHKIPFKEGTSPINLRPYRYLVRHKDIIENFVEEMQDKGVSQSSWNSFASPVVLLKKKGWIMETMCRLQGAQQEHC